MHIKFHSVVLITAKLNELRSFYQDVLLQEIEYDFGNCIGFKNGLSIWELKESYPIALKLGSKCFKEGNKNLEICFESDCFEESVEQLRKSNLSYLHDVLEENWGQRTIRFYDPDENLVELGESLSCFVTRYFKKGMTPEQISEKTSVPLNLVKEMINKILI